MRNLQIPARLLKAGDKLTRTQRYGHKLRGEVAGVRVVGNLVFIAAPILPEEEDVAFQAKETVWVTREEG